MSATKSLLGSHDYDDVFSFSCSDNEIVLANIGDAGNVAGNTQAAATLVNGWKPNAIISNGDQSHNIDLANEFVTYYQDYYDRDLVYPVLGNYDWADDAASYLTTFEGVVDANYYYRKQFGPVMIYFLDSNSVTPDGNGPSSDQALWFQSVLAVSDSPWNIAVLHHPPYSSDDHHGDTADSQWDFTGCDIVLSGHAHTYERIYTGGIYYIVNGLGGSPRYGFGSTTTGSQFQYADKWGAGKLIATPTRLVWRFYSYDGAEVDSLILEK